MSEESITGNTEDLTGTDEPIGDTFDSDNFTFEEVALVLFQSDVDSAPVTMTDDFNFNIDGRDFPSPENFDPAEFIREAEEEVVRSLKNALLWEAIIQKVEKKLKEDEDQSQ